MEPLDEIYQEMILEHNRKPRNFRALSGANRHAHGKNPLCGDDYHVFLSVDAQGVIQDAAFIGKGCAISKASASMLTEAVKGKKTGEAERLKEKFIELVTRDRASSEAELGSLAVFRGVKQFPIRVKCATLGWRALERALSSSNDGKEVSTE